MLPFIIYNLIDVSQTDNIQKGYIETTLTARRVYNYYLQTLLVFDKQLINCFHKNNKFKT